MINMTRARGPAMAAPEPGAAAESRRRRKWRALFGLSVALGVVTAIAFVVTGDPGGAGTIPAAVAAAGAAVYVAMMVLGSLAMVRVTDEHEVHNNVWGLAAGGGALLVVYPAWWMLWRGGLVVEPGHSAMFLLMFGSALVAYLWKKYR